MVARPGGGAGVGLGRGEAAKFGGDFGLFAVPAFGVSVIGSQSLHPISKRSEGFALVYHGAITPFSARFRTVHAAPMPYGIGWQGR